jgi:hypothetical protein
MFVVIDTGYMFRMLKGQSLFVIDTGYMFRMLKGQSLYAIKFEFFV